MIKHGSAPFLECSSKGDQRFSAFYARISGRGGRSIEQIYQAAKVFMDGSTGLGWRQAKGKLCVNQQEVRALYSQLWDEYMSENPELQPILQAATGVSDIFGQPGHACQATELWRIRERLIAERQVDSERDLGRILAVIGTAGRDKSMPMSARLWALMCADFATRVRPDDHLVSGGAAWADHLAVHAYLEGWCKHLTLFLPAPIVQGRFQGPLGDRRCAANAANYYHSLFHSATGVNGLKQILQAIDKGASIHHEPIAPGYGAMFSRNKRVAAMAEGVVAYTFGVGDQPADGGTNNTWQQIGGEDKTHVDLGALLSSQAHRSEQKTDEGALGRFSSARPKFQFVRPR